MSETIRVASALRAGTVHKSKGRMEKCLHFIDLCLSFIQLICSQMLRYSILQDSFIFRLHLHACKDTLDSFYQYYKRLKTVSSNF